MRYECRGINIQIREYNSFTTSTEPLYVVDGMPYSMGEGRTTDYGMKQSNNPLSTISPQDILSIEVLKMHLLPLFMVLVLPMVLCLLLLNPVLRKGKVQLSANLSISNPVKRIDVLDACDYALYRNERITNGLLYDGYSEADSQLEYPFVGYYLGESSGSYYRRNGCSRSGV